MVSSQVDRLGSTGPRSGHRQAGSVARPVFRWAGGKRWLANLLVDEVERSRTYYEPFLGGAGVFLASNPKSAVLGDANGDLMNSYKAIRSAPERVLDSVSRWPNDRQTYYKVRQLNPTDPVERASRFLYLNRTCWNGLYRVNQKGEFNVPFGNNVRRAVVDPDNLFQVSKRLELATLLHGDFAPTARTAQAGDFIFLDPPYALEADGSGFLRYNPTVFSWSDQVRLASLAQFLVDRGCSVAVCNANDDGITDLYPGFTATPLSRFAPIAGGSRHRRMTTELLLTSFENFPAGTPTRVLE